MAALAQRANLGRSQAKKEQKVMDNGNALWLVAEILAAASLSLEEGMLDPSNRDLPLANDLATKCETILKRNEIGVFAITETGHKVQLPAEYDVIRGVSNPSRIVVERFGNQSEIDVGRIKFHSAQFLPGIWEHSELRSTLEKALRLVG